MKTIDFYEELKEIYKDPEYSDFRRRLEELSRAEEKKIARCQYSDFKYLWRLGYRLLYWW